MKYKNIFTFIKKHKIICGFLVAILIVGAYFGARFLQGSSVETRYVLASVERGALITSISGTGQVEAFDEVDLQAKSAGDVIFVGVAQGQLVKTGQLLAQINPSNAQRAVNEAGIALESAEESLEDLLALPAGQEISQAENELAQAQRDLEKTEKTYNEIESKAEKTLSQAYENGYNNVSTSFFKLSDCMKDLKDVVGTDASEQEYVSAYKAILTQNSLFVQCLVDDYLTAKGLYNQTIEFFREVSKNNREDIYKLLSDTKDTAKAVSQGLESARHLYDVLETRNYQDFAIATVVDKMQPKIETDLSTLFSVITSLQDTLDTIDKTVQDTPGNIQDARLAFQAAKEKVVDKEDALNDLKAGASDLDIKTQRNVAAQKEAALAETRESLANCFIKAPFNGIVASINISKGDSVSVGTKLATLITNQQLANIALNEVDASRIQGGQKATLSFDAVEDLEITGKVADVDTLGTVSQGVVSYGVKILFDTQDDRVKPGMTVSANIITKAQQNVLLVPNSAVKSSGAGYYVETLEDIPNSSQLTASAAGITAKTPPVQKSVEIGLANDSYTEIISGLEEGAQIIVRTTTTNQQEQTNTSSGNSTNSNSTNRALRTGGGVMMFGR